MTLRESLTTIVESARNNISGCVNEDYPEGFSLEEFANLRSFNQRVAYCKSRLYRLGTGSSRIAYVVDSDKVLKIAKNAKGVAQNMAESDNTPPLNDVGGELFAQVIESDENGLWLEQERAEPVRADMMRKVVGMTFPEVKDTIINIVKQYKNTFRSGDKKWYDMYNEHYGTGDEYDKKYSTQLEFVNTLVDYFTNYCPQIEGDFYAQRNWGFVTRNGHKHLVVIDNGLTESLYDKFYARSRRVS